MISINYMVRGHGKVGCGRGGGTAWYCCHSSGVQAFPAGSHSVEGMIGEHEEWGRHYWQMVAWLKALYN